MYPKLIIGKAILQGWMNATDPTKMMGPMGGMQQPIQEEEENDDEEMGVAETYADYMPTKCECKNLLVKTESRFSKSSNSLIL